MDKKNVRIRLFKDNSRYKGDLFVSVNARIAAAERIEG